MSAGPEWQELASYAGIGLAGIFSAVSGKLWRDVEKLKDGWLTRGEFDRKIKEVENERDKRHTQNTERLERIELKHHEGQVAIERRLGEVMTRIAELRPTRPDGQPERRRGY